MKKKSPTKSLVDIPKIELADKDSINLELKFSNGESIEFRCNLTQTTHLMTHLAQVTLELVPERPTLGGPPIVGIDVSKKLVFLSVDSGIPNQRIHTLFPPQEAAETGKKLIEAAQLASQEQTEH